jgi:hypothetical protein
MSREAAGLSDDDDFEDDLIVDDDGPSFTSGKGAELEEETDADAPDASEAVIDELLGVGSDDDTDDLDEMADELDFDDLGDMAEDLNEEDEDVDPSFLDDML